MRLGLAMTRVGIECFIHINSASYTTMTRRECEEINLAKERFVDKYLANLYKNVLNVIKQHTI